MQEFTYFDKIWENYDHFIFDFDGVLFSHRTPIGNSLKVLNYLQEVLHKSVYIYTNYAGRSKEEFFEVLLGSGCKIPLKNIYFTAGLAGKYIKKYYPDAKTIYYIGNVTLKEELEKFGFKTIGEEDNNSELGDYVALIDKTISRCIDAIVVGYDNKFNAYKLYTTVISMARGAKLIATNQDIKYCVNGKFMPDTGAILSAIEITAGKKAEIVGKPSAFGFQAICEDHKIKDLKKVIMIGDSINTDILGAKNANIDSCFVSESMAQFTEIQPKYIIPRVDYLSKEYEFTKNNAK